MSARRRLPAPSGPQRIISLVPSITEALIALGGGERVAGATRYCTEPAEALAAVPRIGGTKDPDIAAILALRPDLVIVNMEENRREDAEALRAAGVPIMITYPRSVRGTGHLLRELATALGDASAADPFIAEMEAELRSAAASAGPRPRVLCLIWRRPYMSIGADTYAGDLIAVAGGVNVFAGRDGRYPTLSVEDIVSTDPEVVLLPDEPYPFAAKHRAELEALPIAAARNGRIMLCDGKDVTWHGVRTAGALRRVRALLATGAGVGDS
ncbi:MAG: ABC transporter substrate-binding protein [Dehalococcoidia bacterium]|nr:ABC transporter substrate-binding protein [Dehalococcoidia bacterium]